MPFSDQNFTKNKTLSSMLKVTSSNPVVNFLVKFWFPSRKLQENLNHFSINISEPSIKGISLSNSNQVLVQALILFSILQKPSMYEMYGDPSPRRSSASYKLLGPNSQSQAEKIPDEEIQVHNRVNTVFMLHTYTKSIKLIAGLI